jgi:hypothetical protein
MKRLRAAASSNGPRFAYGSMKCSSPSSPAALTVASTIASIAARQRDRSAGTASARLASARTTYVLRMKSHSGLTARMLAADGTGVASCRAASWDAMPSRSAGASP